MKNMKSSRGYYEKLALKIKFKFESRRQKKRSKVMTIFFALQGRIEAALEAKKKLDHPIQLIFA